MKYSRRFISAALVLIIAIVSIVFPVSAIEGYSCKHVTNGDSVSEYPSSINWGINIHSPGVVCYRKETLEEQFALAARFGSKIIRFNVMEEDLDWMDKFVTLAKAYGIKLMAVYHAETTTDPDELNTVYEVAKMLAERYNGKNGRGKIDYFQLGNETEAPLIQASGRDGRAPDDYFIDPVEEDPSIPNLSDAKKFFATASKAIRDADTDAKICFNFGYYFYGALRYYQEQGIDFDVVGWDWYYHPNTGNAEKTSQIADEIHSYFPDKEIIVCETNFEAIETYEKIQSGTINREDPHNWDGLLANLDVLAGKSYISNIIIYELLDESNISNKESIFGMVNCNETGVIGEPHPIYYDIQKRIGGNNALRKIMISELDLSPYDALKVKTADDTDIKIDKGNTGNDSTVITPLPTFDFDNNKTDDSSTVLQPDENANTANAGNNVKKLNTTRTSYKTPWLLLILSSIGVLVLFSAGLTVFIILQKRKNKIHQ